MRLLEVRGVEVGPPARPALRGVDLRVDAHEIVALVGPSGSGKTDLLRAVVGLEEIRRGEIRLSGRDLAGMRTEERAALGIALVPQHRRLFAGLSVRENLLLGGWRSGHRDLDRVLGYLPMLAGHLDRLAGSLSGGEQALCALGRAVMGRPVLLLVDEPSLGLTPLVAHQLLSVLPTVCSDGTAVLLAEQEPERVLSVAGRGYLLERGKVTAAGTPAVLLSRPA